MIILPILLTVILWYHIVLIICHVPNWLCFLNLVFFFYNTVPLLFLVFDQSSLILPFQHLHHFLLKRLQLVSSIVQNICIEQHCVTITKFCTSNAQNFGTHHNKVYAAFCVQSWDVLLLCNILCSCSVDCVFMYILWSCKCARFCCWELGILMYKS